MAFARRARRAVLPVATRFHGAFCMGAAQRDSPSDCAAEWVRAKNDARRVKPLRFANFPRAAARLAQQAALHLRQFHQTSRRGERVCRRQGLWLSRVARGDAILPVATRFHGAFCMGAAQRDSPGACAAEWAQAKNAARRVKPLRFANFSRAAARLARQAELHPRQFHQLPARRERVCRRQRLWFLRVARGGVILPVATKFHGAFCTERGAAGFFRQLRSGVGASEAPLCREGKRAGPECVWKRKNLQWRGTFRRFQRSMRRLRGAKSRICSAIMAQKTLKLQFRRVSNTLQHGPEQEAPNGSGPKRRWDPGFEAA